jgi:hypothetical protein
MPSAADMWHASSSGSQPAVSEPCRTSIRHRRGRQSRRSWPANAHGLNDKVANVIATTVGSMWMFYASIIGFAVWMAGLGASSQATTTPSTSCCSPSAASCNGSR